MAESRLRNTHGTWVVGDRFWGRERELADLVEHLDEGAHLLIVAQRRIGKTSLMQEAIRRLEEKGRYHCLFVDLQKGRSAADAITELSVATRPHTSLWEKTRSVFDKAGTIDKVQTGDLTLALRSGLNAGNWQAKADRLLAALAEVEPGVVVFFDEVPILVNRILQGDDYTMTPERRQEADAFMSWLRNACLQYRDRLRFVLAGSIGLEPVLRRAGLSGTLNALTPFEVGPWTREEAMGCLEALARQYELAIEPDAAAAMLDLLGICIPHHVQMFFANVYRECKSSRKTTVTTSFVEEVYHQDMLSVRGHAELSHLEERLKMVLGPERYPLALELLTEAAVQGGLTADAAVLLAGEYAQGDSDPRDEMREILGILEHDGYMERQGDGWYVFVSTLLKDWWKARFGFGFVPTAKRKKP